ncbi:MAG: hypothetical protein IJD64_03955 [Clostridia bacterium]|nr:hypothetical protein [Clostridia bacterium]
MYIIGMVLLNVVPYVVDSWYARGVFVVIGYSRRYGHGKSAKRATKHYKSNWSFWQRMLWVPVFKEQYEAKYRRMAYLEYIHLLLTMITTSCYLIYEIWCPQIYFGFVNLFIVNGAFFIFRYLHDNRIATTTKR